MRSFTYVVGSLLALVASGTFAACSDGSSSSDSSSSAPSFSSQASSSSKASSVSFSSSSVSASSQSFVSYSSIAAASDVTISVDDSSELGAYKSFLGVNKTAIMGQSQSNSVLLDVREAYKFVGIDEIRMHDTAIDICKIFTADKVYDKDTLELITDCKQSGKKGQVLIWSAQGSVLDDGNYDFSEADTYVGYVQDVGAKMYLRLGDSYDGVNDVESVQDYAQVATKIYEHYSSMGIISDVEIHNEPNGGFWMGEDSDFYDFVNTTIDNLQAEKIPYAMGGNGFTDSVVRQLQIEESFLVNWFTSVHIDKLDFFSAHYYGDCEDATLADYEHWTTSLRSQIDNRGMKDVPLHITEWNIGLGQQCGSELFSTAKNMSFAMGVMALSQDSALNIEKMFFYAGTGASMSLFSPVQNEDSVFLNPTYWALYISKELQGATRLKSSLCRGETCGDNATFVYENSLLALALKDEKGRLLLVINDTNSSQIYSFSANDSSTLTREIFAPLSQQKLPLVTKGSMKSAQRESIEMALSSIYTKESIKDIPSEVKFSIAPHSVELIRY